MTNKYNLTPEQIEQLTKNLKGTKLEKLAVINNIIPAPTQLEVALRSFIAKEPSTLDIIEQATKLADEDDPVLIIGPTGSGKDLLANILHGNRKADTFVPVNTTAITDSLFEAELFGHRRGSFTGASEDRAGLVAKAEKGTLFLDEIGDMPMSLQTKMLRLIENKQYRRVGDPTISRCDTRFIFATHQNLEDLVEAKKFREDLFYRISTFTLKILPLKERKLDFYAIGESLKLPSEILDRVWSDYPLAGNVRELKALARRFEVFKRL